MRAAGAVNVGNVGTSAAFAFDPADLLEAIELALDLAEESSREGLTAAFGIALGPLHEVATDEGTIYAGDALERAGALATSAGSGDVVLDSTARQLAVRAFLFSGEIDLPGAAGGARIDRDRPHREACRLDVSRLRPAPVAPSIARELAPLRTLAGPGGPRCVVVRGAPGAGASAFLATLAEELSPPLVLRVRPVPAALEPLGSLRFALLSTFGSPDAVRDVAGEALFDVARGAAVPRATATAALRQLLGGAVRQLLGGPGGRPWIVLDPGTAIDPATLDVLSSIAADPAQDVLILVRLPPGSPVPPALEPRAPREITVPPLDEDDAHRVARGVFGVGAPSDVVAAVALLGGPTTLGIVEAARTLVSSGDVCWNGSEFAWRATSRPISAQVPIDSLIEERVAALEEIPLRVLEALCAMPEGAPAELLEAIARADGVTRDDLDRSVERLRREGFVETDDPPRTTSTSLRISVSRSIPPSRAAELHRFVAEVMTQSADADARFARATIGYHLGEGGQERAASKALIEAGNAAAASGFARAAVRLAAAAVQYDPSDATREAASMLTRATLQLPRTERPPPPGEEIEDDDDRDVVGEVLSALKARDWDAVERAMDVAIAEGRDRAAAGRVRALALLASGDPRGAMRALARARAVHGGDRRRAGRESLALALVLLQAGEPSRAVRAALAALANARALRDPRGEAAAMHALASCYRALGRAEDADAIDDASPA